MIEKKYIFFGVLMALVIITAIILNIQQYFQRENTNKIEPFNANVIAATNTSYAQPDSEEALVSCKADSDCIKVSTHPCCSCANGGGEKTINKIYESYWAKEKLKVNEVDCGQTFCATIYNCSDQNPVCNNNVCTIPSPDVKNTNLKNTINE